MKKIFKLFLSLLVTCAIFFLCNSNIYAARPDNIRISHEKDFAEAEPAAAMNNYCDTGLLCHVRHQGGIVWYRLFVVAKSGWVSKNDVTKYAIVNLTSNYGYEIKEGDSICDELLGVGDNCWFDIADKNMEAFNREISTKKILISNTVKAYFNHSLAVVHSDAGVVYYSCYYNEDSIIVYAYDYINDKTRYGIITNDTQMMSVEVTGIGYSANRKDDLKDTGTIKSIHIDTDDINNLLIHTINTTEFPIVSGCVLFY